MNTMTKDQQNNGALYAQNYEELKHQMKTLLRLIGLYELYVQYQTPGSEEAAHAAGMLALYRRHFAQLTGREVKAEEIAAVMQTRKEIVKRLKEPDAEDAAENARDGEQEEVVVNFNPNHGDNGQFTSGAGRHRAGNQRATKGNPRNPTTKSNTPLKAAPGAKPQAQVDATEHALKTTGKKGKVQGAAYINGKPVDIETGNKNFHGTQHYSEHNSPNDTPIRKAARAIGAGISEKDPNDASKIRRRKGETNVSLANRGNRYRFITAHKKR